MLTFANLIPVDDLIAKYGEGQTFVRQCSTCEYEQDIRSKGVYLSAGGAVAVFFTEDEFSCPNCDANQSSNEATYSGKPIITNLLIADLTITCWQTDRQIAPSKVL